ncbi:MAG: DUF3096 domain-containing protein [Dehalococcoidia bacterium]|nr:DUF3096 domain-containing protein [Dehalococcoidia bacterium]
MGLVWGLISIVFGIMVLIFPRLLSYLVGIYLIIAGAIGAWKGIWG